MSTTPTPLTALLAELKADYEIIEASQTGVLGHLCGFGNNRKPLAAWGEGSDAFMALDRIRKNLPLLLSNLAQQPEGERAELGDLRKQCDAYKNVLEVFIEFENAKSPRDYDFIAQLEENHRSLCTLLTQPSLVRDAANIVRPSAAKRAAAIALLDGWLEDAEGDPPPPVSIEPFSLSQPQQVTERAESDAEQVIKAAKAAGMTRLVSHTEDGARIWWFAGPDSEWAFPVTEYGLNSPGILDAVELAMREDISLRNNWCPKAQESSQRVMEPVRIDPERPETWPPLDEQFSGVSIEVLIPGIFTSDIARFDYQTKTFVGSRATVWRLLPEWSQADRSPLPSWTAPKEGSDGN